MNSEEGKRWQLCNQGVWLAEAVTEDGKAERPRGGPQRHFHPSRTHDIISVTLNALFVHM